MNASKHGTPVLIATVMGLLMVFVVASSSVAAAPLAPASTPVGAWSYGAIKTVSVGPLKATDGWTYQGNATYGYTVTVFDNNTSASTFELTIFRTMGVAFTVQFCFPTCSAPTRWVNESYRAWESTTSFTNLTTQGTVEEGTSSVPAVAIDNTTVFLRSNLTEVSDAYLPELGQLGPHTHYLSASISGDSAVTFSPSLGLFPIDLAPGDTWSSSSSFNATGAAQYSYYYAAHAPVKSTVIGPVNGTVALQTNGTVDLAGSYLAGSTFSFGGVSYPAIVLTVTGPFSVREGVIFVPTGADLFGSASQPWGSSVNGSATAAMSTLDLKMTGGGHFGLVASSWRFDSTSVNAADTISAAPTSGLGPAAVASNPVSVATVQGQPETAGQPSQTGSCLETGQGCPALPGGSAPRGLFGLVVLSGAVATVGALLALAVVSRRRSMPPPAYPNSVLYPPGATSPSAPRGAPTSPGSPTPPEDDPLDHLW